MRSFIGFLSSFLKTLLVMILVPFLGASSCPGQQEKKDMAHPLWSELNEPEVRLPQDKCLVTKLGLHRMRFHIANQQKPIHPDDARFKCNDTNIVQTDEKALYWVLTPNCYGRVTSEKFPKTIGSGIKYSFGHDDKETGLPKELLDEWSNIDPIESHGKETILIIAQGIEGKLGVSKALQEVLKKKKEKHEIQYYLILNTYAAVILHNKYVKEGKKVYTFIHTDG